MRKQGARLKKNLGRGLRSFHLRRLNDEEKSMMPPKENKNLHNKHPVQLGKMKPNLHTIKLQTLRNCKVMQGGLGTRVKSSCRMHSTAKKKHRTVTESAIFNPGTYPVAPRQSLTAFTNSWTTLYHLIVENSD